MGTFKVVYSREKGSRSDAVLVEKTVSGPELTTSANAAWEVALDTETPLGAEFVDVVRLD